MEYTVTGAIILILYLERLIQRERKSKPTLHLILLTDRDEMSNLYRGPSIDASYQGSVHLASGFRGENF
jgi:hypothetical protein